jgi:hypothetical protein
MRRIIRPMILRIAQAVSEFMVVQFPLFLSLDCREKGRMMFEV